MQRKSALSTPADAAEREADAIAGQVAGPAGAVPAMAPDEAAVGSAVGAALRGGQPLPADVRARAEARLGYDFSQVRVHTDGSAAAAAHAVGAHAYAYGRDIVFGANRYAPASADGQRLLTHELVHVVQQGGAAARRESRAAAPGRQPAFRTARHIARFVPAAVYAPAPTTSVAAQGILPASGLRYAPQPSNSLAEIGERVRLHQTVEDAKREAERPIATLEPGGSAPDFIYTTGTQRQTLAMEGATWPTFTFRERRFSVLEAIDADVARASSEQHVMQIYLAYFPDSMWPGLVEAGIQQMPAPASVTGWTTLDLQYNTERLIYRPKWFDPGGTARFATLAAALKKRLPKVPALSASALLKDILSHDFDAIVEQQPSTKGQCTSADAIRTGGNKEHDAYAKKVTGSDFDFKITTPEGVECVTDGRDTTAPNRVWEVKTFSEWATDAGQGSGAMFSPYINERVWKLEEQRARCSGVARRCGFDYVYAFDNEHVAAFMRRQWGNRPPVFFKPG